MKCQPVGERKIMNIVDITGRINLPFSASSLIHFAVWTAAADPPDSLNSVFINSNQNNPPTLVTLAAICIRKASSGTKYCWNYCVVVLPFTKHPLSCSIVEGLVFTVLLYLFDFAAFARRPELSIDLVLLPYSMFVQLHSLLFRRHLYTFTLAAEWRRKVVLEGHLCMCVCWIMWPQTAWSEGQI